MLILPAIDILNGRCVRLRQGDFRTPTVYSDSPEATARAFMENGFTFLHVVDLSGARDGAVRDTTALASLLGLQGIRIQAGGGIRTKKDVEQYLQIGVHRIVTGSAAIKNPETVLRWIAEFGPQRFTIALDVRDGFIATEGWTAVDGRSLHDLIRWYREAGVTSFLCTDIERDGMLTGPNVDFYKNLLSSFDGIELIASGGISSLADVEDLRGADVPAVVIGRAFYEGRIDPLQLKALAD
ncbi:MAG: 1-(5-phosphoribosyl)-5-[(5-phosphoribosylamino)methylideneamino]imidazole-4-carboxamide isomerase [Bacteroidota bacterium]